MIPMYIVDAFTDKAFGGNPAAVAILSESRDAIWMQQVAMEMNLSETAFLLREGDGYSLRWFTPTEEVDLCGHATLAAANVLWTEGYALQGQKLDFYTKSGLLSAKQTGESIELDFPLEPAIACEAPDFLIEGLGVKPAYIGKNRMDYLVEVNNEETVLGLKPDFSILAKVECRGVIVTSLARSADIDFVSRCFYPATGVNEDPVTGSAHCCLGPYWQTKLSRSELRAWQSSPRGGLLDLVIGEERIYISGQAVTTLRGTFLK